jgi:hypothetical protein
VDVWTIEYRVWDGTKIIVDKSKNNLEGLRNFFKDVGGYVEHSRLSTRADTSDGMAGENHRPVASHRQTLSHNVVSSTPRLKGIRTHNVSGDRH